MKIIIGWIQWIQRIIQARKLDITTASTFNEKKFPLFIPVEGMVMKLLG